MKRMIQQPRRSSVMYSGRVSGPPSILSRPRYCSSLMMLTGSPVVSNIERSPRDSNGTMLFNINELDWFARNAYNLGLKHLETWDVSHTIQLLTSCNTIMTHFPPSISSEIAADISLKTLFNEFIISSALISRARGADVVEDQLQDYLLARQHIAA